MATYEYSLILKTGKFNPAALQQGDPDENFAVSIHPLFQQVEGTPDSFQGGGWEFVSHSFGMIGDRMMATFLVRRPKPAG